MKVLLFYHSLVSDWNHGNAHFLRGVTTELLKRNYDVQVFEPDNGWSYTNWIKENGIEGIKNFNDVYPDLHTNFYNGVDDFKSSLEDTDLVIVHEWNKPELIEALGDLKSEYYYKLLFHDTHHRSVTSPEEIKKYNLAEYDGVLAFGEKIRDLYIRNNWAKNAWTWHEAADTNVFRPIQNVETKGDLVWIGNWGDNERTDELREFLIEPVKKLGLNATMYGVRYPDEALMMLSDAGIKYGKYLPSSHVPEVYSSYKFTVHVPRRAYAKDLPGIPTIRPFEALACGIPLISAPWRDTENLFDIGKDFLMVNNGAEMISAMQTLLNDKEKSNSLAQHGLKTIQENHTCTHRVDKLLKIYHSLNSDAKKQETTTYSKVIK